MTGPDRSRPARPLRSRRLRVAAVFAVVGPGLLAGLSDDDPAGITTYSVLGAKFGYQMLWVLLASTVALVIFHDLGVRMGVVTGQGLTGLVRQRYGVRVGAFATAALVVANIGTTCAEFAGIAAGFELFGVSRYVSVPAAAIGVSLLVIEGSFRRVQHVLLALSAIFVTYVVAGLLARPDWGAAARGVAPTMPLTRDAVAVATATLGTTLAPWGLSFIQSYAVDKKLTIDDLRYSRLDVVTGSVLTGIIGLFVVVACAATLHATGRSIDDAADAAAALDPLAGALASDLFALGLIGAALLAASILPLSTAYSVSEVVGRPAAVNDSRRDAPLFYGTFAVVTVVGAGFVLLPGAPLIAILVLTQVLNAALLLPLLVLMVGVARDHVLMGTHRATGAATAVYVVTIALIAVCVGALAYLSIT
jgi:NRAMP (natural resistance-associated macrophage protein)-like metal ion transporter